MKLRTEKGEVQTVGALCMNPQDPIRAWPPKEMPSITFHHNYWYIPGCPINCAF